MRAGLALLLAALGCATFAGAQDAPGAAVAAGNGTVTAPKPTGWLLVLDKPYVAVREYNRDQKKDDGSTYKLHETTKFWRDSQGRLRSEVTRDKERVVWTYLTDPAAKVQYRWNNVQKVAYESQLGDPIPARDASRPLQAGEVRDVSATLNGQRTKGQANLLPPKTIDGLATVGSHTVYFSDPARTRVISTTDRWYQPEYHINLETVITDQQYGHRVFEYRTFKPEEPKADLFQVPKGFTIKKAETPDTEQFE